MRKIALILLLGLSVSQAAEKARSHKEPFIKSKFFIKDKVLKVWVWGEKKGLDYGEEMPTKRISSHKAIKVASEYLAKEFGQEFTAISLSFRRIPTYKKGLGAGE